MMHISSPSPYLIFVLPYSYDYRWLYYYKYLFINEKLEKKLTRV